VGLYIVGAVGCLVIIVAPIHLGWFRKNSAPVSARLVDADAALAPVDATAIPGDAVLDARIAQIISEIPQRRVRRHA
jgi:hypothetical protein